MVAATAMGVVSQEQVVDSEEEETMVAGLMEKARVGTVARATETEA